MELLFSGDNRVMRATVAGILLCCRTPEEWLPNAVIVATHYTGTGRQLVARQQFVLAWARGRERHHGP